MLLARVYQVLVLLAGFALLAGAVAAWWAATPGNMLLLVGGSPVSAVADRYSVCGQIHPPDKAG